MKKSQSSETPNSSLFFSRAENIPFDGQGRITIPTAVGDLFPESCQVLLIEMGEGRFLLFPQESARQVFSDLLSQIPLTDPGRDFLCSKCQVLKLEQGKRLVLRKYFADTPDISGVIMIGIGQGLAIWQPEKWEKVQADLDSFAGLLQEKGLEEYFERLSGISSKKGKRASHI